MARPASLRSGFPLRPILTCAHSRLASQAALARAAGSALGACSSDGTHARTRLLRRAEERARVAGAVAQPDRFDLAASAANPKDLFSVCIFGNKGKCSNESECEVWAEQECAHRQAARPIRVPVLRRRPRRCWRWRRRPGCVQSVAHRRRTLWLGRIDRATRSRGGLDGHPLEWLAASGDAVGDAGRAVRCWWMLATGPRLAHRLNQSLQQRRHGAPLILRATHKVRQRPSADVATSRRRRGNVPAQTRLVLHGPACVCSCAADCRRESEKSSTWSIWNSAG